MSLIDRGKSQLQREAEQVALLNTETIVANRLLIDGALEPQGNTFFGEFERHGAKDILLELKEEHWGRIPHTYDSTGGMGTKREGEVPEPELFAFALMELQSSIENPGWLNEYLNTRPVRIELNQELRQPDLDAGGSKVKQASKLLSAQVLGIARGLRLYYSTESYGFGSIQRADLTIQMLREGGRRNFVYKTSIQGVAGNGWNSGSRYERTIERPSRQRIEEGVGAVYASYHWR